MPCQVCTLITRITSSNIPASNQLLKKANELAPIACNEGFNHNGKLVWTDEKNAKVKKEHPNPN